MHKKRSWNFSWSNNSYKISRSLLNKLQGINVNKIYSILFWAMITQVAYAETVYVTDNLRVNVREGQDKSTKVVDVVSSGTPLTVLETTAAGYKKVRLSNGKEGYILGRFTVNTPPSKWLLDQANNKIAQLKEENTQLQTRIDEMLGSTTANDASKQQLILQRDQLNRELAELRQTSANAIDIKLQRDQLRERVVNVERELEQMKREKQALEDSTNQDWFLYGGILAFTGIFLGLLLPRLSVQRKSSWDSF